MTRKRYRRRLRICVLPGYRWCGPGCSGPGAPINEVDAACKAHDECYQRYGSSCDCDRAFLRRLRSIKNPHTRTGRHASLLYEYMKFQILFHCDTL
ncbi:phospholipase [Bacillus sp. FJAT-49732]|uniref:Phospholipase n=1 Tax=Lederbergia citrisecunda TaxID=2833583 RepID=A0A942TRW7_9BACI|nr:phospholipase [Lederbergia citrisecunda]MBS4201022.1 phospholipase [Lederbergia citrisecunda]